MATETDQVFSEKISIIIPVYNVEKYLDRCVQSVLNQSYTNLEVILVDDGSSDGSSRLCDLWAEKDARVRIIHQENRGVSAARNAGLDAATGEYLGFIDSDDYIAPDMYEKLYRSLRENNAEISVCGFYFVDENGTMLAEDRNLGLPIKDQVVTGLDILKAMQTAKRGVFFVFSWNKLYQKQLFSDVRFPAGKLSEDTYVLCRILEQCNRISCISDICYYYVQRSGSYMHNRNCLSYLHEAEARFEHMRFFSKRGLFENAAHAYCDAGLKLQDAIARRKDMPECSAELNEAFQTFRNNFQYYKYCTTKEKMQILFIYHCPRLFNLIFRNPVRKQIKATIENSIAKYHLRNTSKNEKAF